MELYEEQCLFIEDDIPSKGHLHVTWEKSALSVRHKCKIVRAIVLRLIDLGGVQWGASGLESM